MSKTAHVVARLDDFPDGSMRGVEVEGRQILLVRRGADVFAMDGTCPHAGGPLAEGVLDGERVICPWHKAAFDITSGANLDPPAVDDLCRFPVGLRDGEVLVTLEDAARPLPSAPAEQDARCFAIVGAGAAGAAAAQMLRDQGFVGRIVLIDPEDRLPYDRTVLSKSVLAGEEVSEKTPLQDEEFYRRHDIKRWGRTVTGIDPASRSIRFDGGTTLEYDEALIATGGEPVPPKFPGADLANLFLLRNPADADRIVRAAETAKRVVVVGAGFIGMEVAASLRQRGLEVTVVGRESQPFEPVLGAKIGALFRRLHEAEGVNFRLGHKVERAIGTKAVSEVQLDDGSRLAADLVVVGLGVRPSTGFAKDLAKDGALPVDGGLRAADHLYAAGDIAAFPYDEGERIRVEHWRVAEQQGRLAARNMLGAGLAYRSAPYFWTMQFMQQVEYVGHGAGTDELVVRGDLEKPEFVAYYVRDGRVTAALGWERGRDMAAVLALMDRRKDWTVDEIHPEGSSPIEVLARG